MVSDWRTSFERVGTRRSKCLICGEELDHAGGRPQRHMEKKHAEVPRLNVLPVDAERIVLPLGEQPLRGTPQAEPQDVEESVDPRDVRSRVLSFADEIQADDRMPAHARVAAGRLITDIERLQEQDVEEDEDEAEGRVVERYRNALRKKGDLEEEFRSSLRDPAVLERVERLCKEVRAQG